MRLALWQHLAHNSHLISVLELVGQQSRSSLGSWAHNPPSHPSNKYNHTVHYCMREVRKKEQWFLGNSQSAIWYLLHPLTRCLNEHPLARARALKKPNQAFKQSCQLQSGRYFLRFNCSPVWFWSNLFSVSTSCNSTEQYRWFGSTDGNMPPAISSTYRLVVRGPHAKDVSVKAE